MGPSDTPRVKREKKDTHFFFSFLSCSKQKPRPTQSRRTANEAQRKILFILNTRGHAETPSGRRSYSTFTRRLAVPDHEQFFLGLFCFAAPRGSNGEELFEVIMISFKAILNQQPTASDFAYELTQM